MRKKSIERYWALKPSIKFKNKGIKMEITVLNINGLRKRKIKLDKLFNKVRVVVDTGSIYILMTSEDKIYKSIFPKSEIDYIMDMIKDSSAEEFNKHMESLDGWTLGHEDEQKFLNYIRENGYLYEGHNPHDTKEIKRFIFEREIDSL